MAPKAKARTQAKAKAAARRLRQQQLAVANARQKLRRQALAALNSLTGELQLAAAPLVLNRADSSKVEQRVRLLQRRCPDAAFRARLHVAAKLYADNGGKFSVDLVDEEAHGPMEVPFVTRHKVLQGDFRLHSQAFMLTYHSRTFTQDTWPAFAAFVKGMQRRFGCKAWAACLEQGTTPLSQDRYHLHAYLYWNDGHGIDLPNTDAFVFAEVRPRVDARTASASPLAAKLAAYHGLWYVTVMKLGTKHADTNFHAWTDYTPAASWIDGLWSAKKLSHAQYLALAREVGAGYAQRKRDAQEVMRDELEASIRDYVAAEAQRLPRLPVRGNPQIDEFVQLFAGGARWRRPILLLLAATNLGKSMLAEHVLTRIGELLGIKGYLEVTVEADEHFDLSEYHHEKHAGVLFDGVGDALLIKRNRELLQGRPKACKGGKSATMKYAYPLTLCRRAVVVTMDLSAANTDLLYTDHWLSDPSNVMLVRLTEPAWETGAAVQQAVPLTKRETMTQWTVGDVVSFLTRKDLAGPASVMHANGVNGADLLGITTSTLEQDLRMSSFAARKVVSARDSYLQSL